MELIKKTCFIIIPITTLLIALAYGLEIIFGINITYLGTTINGTYYENVYDFKAYLENLNAEDIIKPFLNLGESLQMFSEPIESIKSSFTSGNLIDKTFGLIYNIFVILIDIVIFLVDILISIAQCIIIIVSKLWSLVGINTKADNPFFNIFRTIANFNITKGMPGWTSLTNTSQMPTWIKPILNTI